MSRYILDEIARRLAGDIVMNPEPGRAMKRWRAMFNVTQHSLARILGVKPSVISDYENGKRIPGSRLVRRYVEGLLELDGQRGWETTRRLARSLGLPGEGILDMGEFEEPIGLDELALLIDGVILNPDVDLGRRVYGYTIVDSIKSILSLSGMEFYHLLGLTNERVIVFTNVSIGRSPMIAVRVSPVKPSVVVVHGPRRMVDPLAIRIAELERIPFLVTTLRDASVLVERLASKAARSFAHG